MIALFLEGLIAIAVSLSVLMAIAWLVQQWTGNSGWVDTIWTFSLGLVGVASEALADAQLKNFRVDPANKGRVCDVGLWRWSRHPNYFFEWFGWLAYPVIALSMEYAWGWATLLAPVFMYWILVHVTGIPPLERQMLRSRGERYRDYQSRTSMFFLLPPQKGAVT